MPSPLVASHRIPAPAVSFFLVMRGQNVRPLGYRTGGSKGESEYEMDKYAIDGSGHDSRADGADRVPSRSSG